MKPFTLVRMNQDALPKVKLTIGDSMVSAKKDTLFGNTIAIKISNESELVVVQNFIDVLSDMLKNVEFKD